MKQYRQLLKELPSNKVVFAFGRFSPPTVGHELIVKTVKQISEAQGSDHVIFAADDLKETLLSQDKKSHYMNIMFPGTNVQATDLPTIVEAAKELNKKYKNIVMVTTADCKEDFQKILNTKNGKHFFFETIEVVTAGDLNPDKNTLKESAKKGDYTKFKKYLPTSLREIDSRRLMNDMRKSLGLDVIKEDLNLVKDELREQYFRKEIFNIGDIVECDSQEYTIVKRGANHLLLKEQSGNLVSKWIQDVKLVKEDTMLQEELTDKTLRPTDKIKVARIIADMLGVTKVESTANPENLVNTALRRVKSKALNAEGYKILEKMLQLATEVGIEYDTSLKPAKLKEDAPAEACEVQTPALKSGHTLHAKNETHRRQKIAYHLGEGNKLTALDKYRRASASRDKKQAEHEAKLKALPADQRSTAAIDALERSVLSKEDKDPCWTGYKQLGMKKKNGKQVPNCVPVEESLNEDAYKDSEGHLDKADKAQRNKDMFSHHMHMADHHDSLSQWHDSKGRSDAAEKHAMKAADHEEMAHAVKQRLKEETITESHAELDKHISTFAKGINSDGAQHSTYKNGGGKIHNMKHVSTDADHHAIFKHLQKMGYKKTSGHDPKPHEFDMHHNHDSMTTKSDPVHHSSGVSAHIEKEHGGATKVHFTHHKLKEEVELEEGTFKYHMDKAIEADTRGDQKKKEYHLGNAKTARYAMKTADYSKHKDLFDKYKQMSEETTLAPELDAEQNLEDQLATELDLTDEQIDHIIQATPDEDIEDEFEEDEYHMIDDETGEPLPADECSCTMEEQAILEVLSRTERMRAKVRFAKSKSKREVKAKIALKSHAPAKKVNQRARRLAIKLMKKRMLRGRDYNKISVGEKERIERVITKRKQVIDRVALKLIPRIRNVEKARLSHHKYNASSNNNLSF
jgi:hypothetical protein